MGMLDSWLLALLTVHDLSLRCTPPTHFHGHARDLVSGSNYKVFSIFTLNTPFFNHSLSLCGLTCSGVPLWHPSSASRKPSNHQQNCQPPASHFLLALPHDAPCPARFPQLSIITTPLLPPSIPNKGFPMMDWTLPLLQPAPEQLKPLDKIRQLK